MNYERIYSEFIADRLTKQPVKPVYFEKHHIIPKSLGGRDEKENLIRLTPEDHYFAHCCLAKTHGGKMWFALKAISAGWTRKIHKRGKLLNRTMIGVARRMFAEENSKRMSDVVASGDFGYFAKSGADNVLHNATAYDWVNLDSGKEKTATIYAMWKEFGSSRAHWTSVQTGARRTHAGWTLKGSSIRIRGLKGKALVFVNLDGRQYIGTQKDFCALTGLSVAVASRVCRHGHKTLCGWRIADQNEENTASREY